MNEAAGHQLERTEQEIVFRVVNAYYGALLATKQLELRGAGVKDVAVNSGSQSVAIRRRLGRWNQTC